MLDSKRVAAIRFEGTVTTASPSDTSVRSDLGTLRDDVLPALVSIHAQYYTVIVSSAVNAFAPRQRLHAWLLENHVPFDELWDGLGLPAFDVMVDDAAHDVSDKSLRLLLGSFGEESQ